MNAFTTLTLVNVSLILATHSFAQNVRKIDDFEQHNLSRLLNVSGVQEDLEMTERQKLMLLGSENGPSLAMQDAWVKYKSELDPTDNNEQANKKLQEFRLRVQQIVKKEKEKLQKILLPHQMERMRQLQLQLLGDQIWFMEDVYQQIGLLPHQVTEIQRLVKNSRKEIRQKREAVPRESSKTTRETTRREIEQLLKQAAKQVKEHLNSEQNKKLKKMLGDKFDFDAAVENKKKSDALSGDGKTKVKK